MPRSFYRRARTSLAGFTLLEVMLSLSILAVALVGLLGRTTANVRETEEAAMRGVAVNLARGKMFDIEAELLDEGFQELEQTLEGDFSDEGWPKMEWEAVIEKTELPSMSSLEAMQGGAGEGEGDGSGDGAGQGGILSGILSGGVGGGSGDGSSQNADTAFISSQFEMISQVLEESIRKVTLTVRWKLGRDEHELVVACYFTDSSAIGRVLPGFGGGIPGLGGTTGGGATSGARTGTSNSSTRGGSTNQGTTR